MKQHQYQQLILTGMFKINSIILVVVWIFFGVLVTLIYYPSNNQSLSNQSSQLIQKQSISALSEKEKSNANKRHLATVSESELNR